MTMQVTLNCSGEGSERATTRVLFEWPDPDDKGNCTKLLVSMDHVWSIPRQEERRLFHDYALPGIIRSANAYYRLKDALANMLGAFDTPLRRAKMPSYFGDEVCNLARELMLELKELEDDPSKDPIRR